MHSSSSAALLESRCRERLAVEIGRTAGSLGFETFSATAFLDRLDGETILCGVDNTPQSYLSVFLDRSSGQADPVMQHCKRSGVPILWDQSTYVECGAAAKWEVQAQYGYRCGIAMGMHLPRGEHFFLGFDRSGPLPRSPANRRRLLADFSLLAIYCQVAAAPILVAVSDEQISGNTVTPREREVLAWTFVGKTAWEVGQLLSISERTAAIHANRASHKLDCISKHQAALKARRLGLI